MSSFTPQVQAPYPNVAVDEVLGSQNATKGGAGAAQALHKTPVKTVETVNALGPAYGADAMEMSSLARDAARKALRERMLKGPVARENLTAAFDPVRDAGRIRNNRGVRELVGMLNGYDNSRARERFEKALDVFVNYNALYTVSGEIETSFSSLTPGGNVYPVLGFTMGGLTAREVRENIGEAIDGWLGGEGVFSPVMLQYSSTDGFRFAPLSEKSRMSLRAAAVMATYERGKIAAYLRDMASLTPLDFIIYDTTGLGALGLQARRDFLRCVDRMMEEARIYAKAVDFQYLCNAQGLLLAVQADLENEEDRIRLESITPRISGYYATLMEAVKQYGPGVISASME